MWRNGFCEGDEGGKGGHWTVADRLLRSVSILHWRVYHAHYACVSHSPRDISLCRLNSNLFD